ncbi:hypothetical protein ElyMa_003521400, partial [Elysia marginata]
ECSKITRFRKEKFSIYLAPKSPYGRYITSIPDEVLSNGDAHDAVLVLDPYPDASLGHVVLVFFVNTTTSRLQCQLRGGMHLDKDECMYLAQRKRCHNAPARKSRRRNFASRCEINFLPTVHLDTEQSRTKGNHLSCRSGLPGYHTCPETWSLNQSSVELCDPLSHNSHQCVTTPDTIRTSCRVFEVCDQAVIVSGGWNSLTVGPGARQRVVQMAQLFKKNGFKRRNIKIFHANGIGQIKTNEDEQPVKVYPSAMKLALRHHLKQMCRTVRCVDTLGIYLNSPTLHGGDMLLWDLNRNGLAEKMERYSVEELLSDIANCSANFVQVLVDQSYAGEISHAVKHSRHHDNVLVMSSGRGHEQSHAGEFTQFWSSVPDTRACTAHLHRASTKALMYSHPTIANPGTIRRTLSGAPCDVKPPFTNRELRREYFGCQNLPTKAVVRNILKEKCRIERVDSVIIERAHRIGRRPRRATGGSHRKPRALIVRFNNYNDRERVRETRRHLPPTISVTEDLPYQVRQARRQLIPEMLEAKRTGKAAWLAYPARLIINGEEVKSVTPRPQPQMSA